MERSARITQLLSNEDFLPFHTDHYALRSELMTKVMVRLPSLTILSFKTVNSNWLRSIQSTHFGEEQARFGEANRPGLLIHSDKFDEDDNIVPIFHLFQPQENKIYKLPTPHILKDALSTQIFSTYRGMVLMKCLFEDKNKILFLWNPVTSEFKELLNLNSLHIEDVVASFAYSEKKICYVALMFMTQTVKGQGICKLGVHDIKKNQCTHFHDFSGIPIDFVDPHSVVLNHKVYFLGLKIISNNRVPNYVLEYNVDLCKFNMIKVPTTLSLAQAKLVKQGSKIVLLSWDQFENSPFIVHVSTVDVDGKSLAVWRKLGVVGPISPDETPVGVWSNNLIVVRERNYNVPWICNVADRVIYRYSMDNRIRETMQYQMANFNVIDVVDFSDSLLFTREL